MMMMKKTVVIIVTCRIKKDNVAGCIIVHISSWWMGYLQHKSCIEFNENYVLEKIVKWSVSLGHSDDPHLKCVFE